MDDLPIEIADVPVRYVSLQAQAAAKSLDVSKKKNIQISGYPMLIHTHVSLHISNRKRVFSTM